MLSTNPRSTLLRLLLAILIVVLASYPVHVLSDRTEHRLSSDCSSPRSRTRLHTGWRFQRFETSPDNLIYDLRPDRNGSDLQVVKPWILAGANDFIADPDAHHQTPSQFMGNATFAQNRYDDSDWEIVNVPHDWAIKGPFQNDSFLGSMGSLPVYGVGWCRHSFDIPADATGSQFYLDVDGAMSYPMVWLNEVLVGGWAYGYNSFRIDLTPQLKFGESNLFAIRTEGPWDTFSRWYPGAGLYRNVWLTRTAPVHVSQDGTHIMTRDVSEVQATVDLSIEIENRSGDETAIFDVLTDVHELDHGTGKLGAKVASFLAISSRLDAGEKKTVSGSITLEDPKLWGPVPLQTPNLYVAITRVSDGDHVLDEYQTEFGIRNVELTPNDGLLVNNERVYIQGVNMHHDFGSIGAAYNRRAAERQFQILQEMGVNAIRTSHNPPAPELLTMADRMGILIMDEIFDVWEQPKTVSDYHLIFPDWHEPDLRTFLRRDRNHPSIFLRSFGNEVPEQTSNDTRAFEIASTLGHIVKEEDPTRPFTCSLNLSKPNQTLSTALSVIALNYQGEGIRYGPAYSHLTGNRSPPQYAAFHSHFPTTPILGSEIAWSLSTRSTFLFPPTPLLSAPANDTNGGGNASTREISAYELYSSQAGSSPEFVFQTQDNNSFVAGGFVWVGWDHLGEPYPYASRSAISGIVDLAGFRKERFWLYQARWRAKLRMAKIVPHWSWPERVGRVTPVNVFTSADEGELWVNGVSQGRLRKAANAYRFRWDEVVYEPGEIHVATYKNGEFWANDTVKTAGPAARLRLTADRSRITADGEDLSFVTAEVLDVEGNFVPTAGNLIGFETEAPGEIVATDNGWHIDYTSFESKERVAYHGLALAIVKMDGKGSVTLKAKSEGLEEASIQIEGI